MNLTVDMTMIKEAFVKEGSMEQTKDEMLILLIRDCEKKLNRPLKRAEITLLKAVFSKEPKSLQ